MKRLICWLVGHAWIRFSQNGVGYPMMSIENYSVEGCGRCGLVCLTQKK